MSATTHRAKESAADTRLTRIAKELAEFDVRPSIGEAVQRLLVALNYNNDVLKESSLHALVMTISDFVQEQIDGQIGLSAIVKAAFQELRDAIRGNCFENVDEFGQHFIRYVDHVIRRMTDLQNVVLQLRKLGNDFRNLTELQFEIDALLALKEKITANWPWSAAPPPLDKEMVARSRAAFERGEGKTVEELLKGLGDVSA